jgi:polyhydroxyalkanoate synthesis regulator protein
MVGGYLDQSLKLFMGQQQQLRDRVKEVVGIDPVGMVAGIAQKNYQRWKTLQEELFRNFATMRHDADDEKEPRPRSKGEKR